MPIRPQALIFKQIYAAPLRARRLSAVIAVAVVAKKNRFPFILVDGHPSKTLANNSFLGLVFIQNIRIETVHRGAPQTA